MAVDPMAQAVKILDSIAVLERMLNNPKMQLSPEMRDRLKRKIAHKLEAVKILEKGN